MKQRDMSGRDYWEKCWAHAQMHSRVDPRVSGLNNYVVRRFHKYFCETLRDTDTRGRKLLEVGCAGSAWLPYFATHFGFEVCGLDYSERGCRMAEQILERERVEGAIVCADLFAPPTGMRGVFDVVVSFGLVEHFADTTGCIEALSYFVKPGGQLITTVPNMASITGWLQKVIDRRVYEIHLALDRKSLEENHRRAGLEVISCNYFLLGNLGVLNVEGLKDREYLHAVAIRLRSWLSKIAWLLETAVPTLKPNRWTSPYVACHARKRSNCVRVGMTLEAAKDCPFGRPEDRG